MRRKKNAFTLIELIAVLVILAIIALIVTPLVMNIVKKAKNSANKRSVDAYGKAVELAVATHLLDNGEYPTDLNGLTIEYSGNEVVCNVKTLNEDGSIYLSECSVSGRDVKDSSTEDGWYHYGKNASLAYQAYSVGDVVTYNEMNFYVIEASDENSDRVTMLKAEPLTVDEVNTYGAGHINMYVNPTSSYYQTASDINGYGGMAYYTSETCGYLSSSYVVDTGCTTDYSLSDVKNVIDAWATDKFSNGTLIEDATGYSARLLTMDDFTNRFGYIDEVDSGDGYIPSENSPSWVYSSDYRQWTMIPLDSTIFSVWYVSSNSNVYPYGYVFGNDYVVRPVITLKKSAIN